MERWRTKTDIDDARKDEQWTTMKARLDSIDNSVSWIVRLIGGAIVLAIMAYLVRGGFSLPHI